MDAAAGGQGLFTALGCDQSDFHVPMAGIRRRRGGGLAWVQGPAPARSLAGALYRAHNPRRGRLTCSRRLPALQPSQARFDAVSQRLAMVLVPCICEKGALRTRVGVFESPAALV